MVALVITFSGADRAGIVDAIAATIVARGGNWEESRSVSLAGYYAGVVKALVPPHEADALERELGALEGITAAVVRSDRTERQDRPAHVLHLVGADHRGIVHQITQVLVRHGVSIDELETSTESAPMDGGILFRAEAALSCPAGVDLGELTSALEQLADDLVVEITFGSEQQRNA